MRYDATNGQTDSYLIQPTTTVYYLESPDKVKSMPFSEMQTNQTYQIENIKLRCEKVVDMVQQAEFICFVAIESFSDKDIGARRGKLGFKNIYFCVFAFETMSISTCEPINPTSEDMMHFLDASDFAICRTSTVQTTKYDYGNRGGFNFSALQQKLMTEKLRLSVAFYFQSLGKYLIKEFIVEHHHIEGPPQDRFAIETESIITLFGQKELLVKKAELTNFGYHTFGLIPYFDEQGLIHGSTLVIQGTDDRVQLINLLQDEYNNQW